MATYTSTQDGNWNAAATWGGGGWPSLAGDVANVGHAVAYNISSTAQLGDLTITSGGTLSFDDSANRKIIFGHSEVTVEAGGQFGDGKFDAAYTLEIYWNTTADNAKGLVCEDNGIVDLQDDPDYYGDEPYTSLAADGDGTTGIITSDDRSSDWNVGDQLLIHIGNTCSGDSCHEDDWILTSIAAISGTSITCVDAVSTDFKSGGLIAHLTRNVIIGKLGHPEVLGSYGSNRPRIENTDTTTFDLQGRLIGVEVCDIQFGTFGGVVFGANDPLKLTTPAGAEIIGIIANCEYAMSDGSVIDGSICDVLACAEVARGCHSVEVRDVVGCADLSTEGASNITIRNLESCNMMGTTSISNLTITGDAFYNTVVWLYVFGGKLLGGLGYDGAIAKANTYDAAWEFNVTLFSSRFGTPSIYRNISGIHGVLRCEDFNQVAEAQREYRAFGDVIKVASDGTGDNPTQRPGGCSNVIEVVPQSNCDDDAVLEIFGFDEVFIYQDVTTAKTYRVYIQTDFVTLPSAELVLTARYPSSATTGATADVDSIGSIATRVNQADWSQYLEVSVTPSRVGLVEFRLELRGYEAGKKVWVDPVLEIT